MAELNELEQYPEEQAAKDDNVLTSLVEELPLAMGGDDPVRPADAQEMEVLESEAPLSISAEERVAASDPDHDQTVAFLQGSEQAFLKLYAKYEAPLLLYCKRMLANDHVAEDAFQELWIKVFELRNREVTITSFRALLFRSARNLCLNMLRLERSRAGSSDRLIGILAPDETDFRTERREIKSLLRQALARVPFNEREAFVMHEYSGYSYAEIAEIMKTNEANIKVRAYRARTRLRKLIQGWLGLAADADPLEVI